MPATSPRQIVLTGFMGAGKSTVGPLLAQHLAWPFIDVDQEIESAEGATIAELFSRHGEPWFRAQEHQAIRTQLAAPGNRVLALGGGAIEDPATRALLLTTSHTTLIHLEASLETVLERCNGTDSQRPILADRTNLESRYLRRLPLYRLAHFTIPVDSLTPPAVVEAILAVPIDAALTAPSQ